jgi:hypothetical protein
MSTNGPSGGQHPGQPQDPWQGGQPADPYGPTQAHDPWGTPSGPPAGDQPTQPQYGPAPYGQGPYGQPQYGQAPYGQPQYGQPPADPGAPLWGTPAPPPRKRRIGLIIGLAVAFVALLCAGAGTAAYLAVNKARTQHGAASTSTTAPPPPTATTDSPSPTQANDALAAQVGDCLTNDGTDADPQLRKVTCAKGTFEVIKRIPGITDGTKCEGLPGYSYNYVYDSSDDTEDFVLCLKQRK